jgi:hypothetical protein
MVRPHLENGRGKEDRRYATFFKLVYIENMTAKGRI